MLSNKLTFSLVLVLMCAFVAAPVFGQVVIPADSAPGPGEFLIVTAATPANGIMARTGADPGAAVLSSPNISDNLAELLAFGGLIELSIASTAAATEDAVAMLKHGIVISEIMWGTNNGVLTAQWIEIYNHNIDTPGAITISFSRTSHAKNDLGMKMQTAGADTADATDDVYMVYVDQVSTINNLGASWVPPGNSGNVAGFPATTTSPGVAPTPLVSMYRKVNLKSDGSAMYKVKKPADGGGLDGLGDGTAAGSWAASMGRGMYQTGNYIASPGGVHVGVGGVTVTTTKTPSTVSATGIIINEVRNDTAEANLDWIELYYNGDPATDNAIDINGYELNIVMSMKDADGKATGVAAKEKTLVDFPAYKLRPGEYFVVYNRSPEETSLAAGVNVDAPKIERLKMGASHAYSVSGDLNLPNNEKFLLVLRSANDQDNEPDAVKDHAGNGFFTASGRGFDGDHYYNTAAFPLNGWTAPAAEDFGNNTFASSNMSWGRITSLMDDGMYRPKSRANDRSHGDDWMSYGYMGTGYDRSVDKTRAPGTPGYANVAINEIANDRDNEATKKPYAFSGMITISEVMYDAGPRWNLVQWIELYNSSMTETINLAGWEMEIRNESTDVESYVDSSFMFDDATYILPNQTLLIVSGSGANDVDSTRVYNLNQRHRRELGLANRDSRLLSAEGFALKLWAKISEGGESQLMLTDQAGNVEVKGAARIHMWDLPERGDIRMSIVRQYGSRDLDGNGPDDASDGTMETSWKPSDVQGVGFSYYGHRNDIGTPGFRLGGPLPVSLSSFRPVRNQDTGHVDITWITQSELNNAGFNILRAESKTGEFKVINVKGIVAGHGTTSEKHVYTFTDTTAKPNVVYYYQIEDVSINGNRTTLTTTHLRGHVGAAGKLTTRWSELKSSK